jgi:hypothetical protein
MILQKDIGWDVTKPQYLEEEFPSAAFLVSSRSRYIENVVDKDKGCVTQSQEIRGEPAPFQALAAIKVDKDAY